MNYLKSIINQLTHRITVNKEDNLTIKNKHGVSIIVKKSEDTTDSDTQENTKKKLISHSLKIYYQNCNSLNNKIIDFKNNIFTNNNKFDNIVLTDTWLESSMS